MRHFNPRLRSAFSGIAERLRQMYTDYELWCDRKYDERTSNTPAAALSRDEILDGVTYEASSTCRIRCNPDACPRSVLLVPATGIADMCRTRKRHPIAADVIILDLTNCNARGGEARECIMQFLDSNESNAKEKRSHGSAEEGARYIVRVNSPEVDPVNGILDMEITALLGERIEGVALPAVTRHTYTLVEKYIHPSHRLWAFFETPRSVLQATEICSQGCYCCAVMDMREVTRGLHLSPMTMMPGKSTKNHDRSDCNSESDNTIQVDLLRSLPLAHSSCQVMLVARANGMFVLDGAFADTTDKSGFRRDLCYSRALGFDGKVVLRPAQLTACHEAFTPIREEAEWARELREQLRHKRNNGVVLGPREKLQWRQAKRVIERYNEGELERKELQN